MSNEEKLVKVARLRSTPYTFNWIAGGDSKSYKWIGSKGKMIDIKELPIEAVNYLIMNSTCFCSGSLKIIEDEPITKKLVENIGEDREVYEANTHTREDLEKLINGNYKKLESELKKMNKQEIQFAVEVAKEMKLDSSTKQKVLAEALGAPVELIFSDEE